MGGGLLNIVSLGSENEMLNGNPKKTFFKAVYNKYSNFGMQKFRLDYDGLRILQFNSETKMIFKIKRYADLLKNLTLVVNIPDIWSPLQKDASGVWQDTSFKWVEELGFNMIKEIEYSIGGLTIAKYSGEYLSCIKSREMIAKKELLNHMIGNTNEFKDPANYEGRTIKKYPSVYYQSGSTPEPSINGRLLYIPIDQFFAYNDKSSIPLISLQYSVMEVAITFRPVKELYTIRNIVSGEDLTPNLATSTDHIYRFIQPPTETTGLIYENKRNDWNADVHLIGTYIFLSDEERKQKAKMDQTILIRDVYETDKFNTTGSKMVKVISQNMVANYMFRFRRSDAYERNQWSNYTNWKYDGKIPQELTNLNVPTPSSSYITGPATTPSKNNKLILRSMGILCDGKYREQVLDSGVFNYLDPYHFSKGSNKNGLYLYSFELATDMYNYQPSGAMNMSKFKNIEFELTTILPESNPNATFETICNLDGTPIGVRKGAPNLNLYNYDLRIFEERYNIILFTAGNGSLVYAR